MARQTCRSQGEITADGVVRDSRAIITAVMVITDGTNSADLILYDNATAASGTKLFEGGALGTVDRAKLFNFTSPIYAENGVFADITGTGASAIVYIG